MYFPSKCSVYSEHENTSIQTKQNLVIFVQHFSFLSDKNFPTVGQLYSNISEDFKKTESDGDTGVCMDY